MNAALTPRHEAPAEGAGEAWIVHDGKENPAPGQRVDVKMTFTTFNDIDADTFDWNGRCHWRRSATALRAQPPAREDAQPVGSIDGEPVALPSIAVDGPHRPCEHRLWLARQLLDSRMDDAEAYSTVAFSPAITGLHPAPDALRVAVEALGFYRDGFSYKIGKKSQRIEWFATEQLLDDCGNKALDALAALQAEQGAK